MGGHLISTCSKYLGTFYSSILRLDTHVTFSSGEESDDDPDDAGVGGSSQWIRHLPSPCHALARREVLHATPLIKFPSLSSPEQTQRPPCSYRSSTSPPLRLPSFSAQLQHLHENCVVLPSRRRVRDDSNPVDRHITPDSFNDTALGTALGSRGKVLPTLLLRLRLARLARRSHHHITVLSPLSQLRRIRSGDWARKRPECITAVRQSPSTELPPPRRTIRD